jgi:hypothetical protein
MNRHVRIGLTFALLLLVAAEAMYVHMLVGRVYLLRDHAVPDAKARYDSIHNDMEEIGNAQQGMGGPRDPNHGVPAISDLQGLARMAGINAAPNVRQWAGTTRSADINETLSEIKFGNAGGEALFKFLKGLEEYSPAGRIKLLSLSQGRGKTNEFDLTVQYATYTPKEETEKKAK